MTVREEWFVRGTKQETVNRLRQEAGLSPVTARILAARGITDPKDAEGFLKKNITRLLDGMDMADMARGVAIVAAAIRRGDKILVVGDYDADGITSTSILLHTLTDLGAVCGYRIPNRISDGYGINENIVREAILGGVRVILTCDNGISAAEQINAAVSAGLSVVVTDHHQIPDFLPPAHAVINPHRQDCPYGFKDLCGAGVAYKFAQCLYAEMGRDTYDDDYLLQLAAIGTICDVVSLTGENRIIASHGLSLLSGTGNVGLRALAAAAGLEGKSQTAYTVGYVIGPCLNATGRLEDASMAIRLLLERDASKAAEQAARLVELNRERQRITDRDYADIMAGLEGTEDNVIVAYSPDVSESVAGIVAGRVREALQRPAIVLCNSGEAGVIKGSARSVEGVNIYGLLTECSDLLTKYGGHPMAAGLSLKLSDLEAFRTRIAEAAAAETPAVKVMIDVPMPVSAATPEMAAELTALEPFGKDNERPLFADKGLRLTGFRPLGAKGRAAEMTFRDRMGRTVRTVVFTDFERLSAFVTKCGGIGDAELDVCYNINIDTYGGQQRLSIIVTHYRQSGGSS